MTILLFKPQRTKIKLPLIVFLLCLMGLAVLVTGVNNANAPKIADGVTIEGVSFGGLTEAEAQDQLRAMANLRIKWPQDAGFTDDRTLQEGVKGKIIPLEETMQKLKRAPKDAKLTLNFYSIEPGVNVDELSRLRYGLATAKEYHFLEGEDFVSLKKLSDSINNQLMYPGEEFSLAEFLAIIPESYSYSHNVTQILARSLYHCIEQGNLAISEKWEADQPKVGSVSTDNINFGLGQDLKFNNNLNEPIIIRSSLDKEVLKVWILTSTASEKQHLASFQASTKSSK